VKQGNAYTDKEIGKHVFELAGLGLAPFNFVGMIEKIFKAGDQVKAGGTCAFCGTGIRFCCRIESADGKSFIVGTDCVNKTGDKGIIEAYKNSAEYRSYQRELRYKREYDKIEQVKQLIADNSEKLASFPHPRGFQDRATGKPLTFLDHCNWYMANAGNSGKCSLFGQITKRLNQGD